MVIGLFPADPRYWGSDEASLRRTDWLLVDGRLLSAKPHFWSPLEFARHDSETNLILLGPLLHRRPQKVFPTSGHMGRASPVW